MLPLYSSMQNEDSLDGGESLYIAELRRARELLALAEGGAPALFLIYELSTHMTKTDYKGFKEHRIAD